jgi:hypothetical protein
MAVFSGSGHKADQVFARAWLPTLVLVKLGRRNFGPVKRRRPRQKHAANTTTTAQIPKAITAPHKASVYHGSSLLGVNNSMMTSRYDGSLQQCSGTGR